MEARRRYARSYIAGVAECRMEKCLNAWFGKGFMTGVVPVGLEDGSPLGLVYG